MIIGILLGVVIGILIALPTGPVGFLCIRRTLLFGKRSGLRSVFGSVFADLFFSTVVIFSLVFILSFFEQFSLVLQGFGGVLFMVIAWRAYGLSIDDDAVVIPKKTPIGDFFSTFTLTFTNPTFIFSLSFLFAFFNVLNYAHDLWHKVFILVGVVFGSLLFWISFVFTIDHIHRKRNRVSLSTINKASAWVIGVAGVVFLVAAFVKAVMVLV